MSQRKRRIALLTLLALLASVHVLDPRARLDALRADRLAASKERMAAKRAALHAKGRYDDAGFEHLSSPRPGEWLDRFPESAQDFDDYTARCFNKRGPARERIDIRPLGPLSPLSRAAFEPVRRYCEAFFGLETRILPEEPIPASAFVEARAQYDADALLRFLEKERPEDAIIYVGLADKDLYAQDLNFVFGLGSLGERVGVYSFTRFSETDVGDPQFERLYRRRGFQLVVHELGHILSLEHCCYHRCVMNGCATLPESDAAGVDYCPVCLEKLRWNVGFDPVKRTRAVAALLRAEGLEADARRVEARALALERGR